jgi:hypothetical protein
VETGALAPDDPGELEALNRRFSSIPEKPRFPCPSGMSDDELMAVLQEHGWEEES